MGGRLGGCLGRCRYGKPRRMQGRLRLAPHGVGAGALDRQQFRLGLPDSPRDVAIPAGLASLPLQCAKLRLELASQIFRARHVGLGGAQLQFCLVAARMQAGDAGGFLQHRAAILRPSRDQRADPSLADHAGGMRAGRHVGEQGLHVAGTHLLAVHPILAARSARDTADDLQLGLLMERRRHRAGGLVQRQGHLGQIARRPTGGAGEDHIIHLACAERARALLAHRPAQRLHHVGLAAAVRADNAGQAGVDFHADGFGETLESDNAQAAEMHGQYGTPSLTAEKLGEPGGRHVALVELPIDQEAWSRSNVPTLFGVHRPAGNPFPQVVIGDGTGRFLRSLQLVGRPV